MPKKTGIDKITQIEDYDLFDYDEEVQPILNVLLSKTIDQACLEVEEEFELEDIVKFKEDYKRRREVEDGDWQHEVKKEISRIKIKNKALENARKKREQQIETMNKLQCLNVAKNFLANNFKQSMQFLADKNHWRDTFKDQLNINFQEWLMDSVSANLANKQQSSNQNNEICDDEILKLGMAQQPIRRKVQFDIQKKEKFRMIESKDKRIVHFLFNPGFPASLSPFAKNLTRFMDGTLEETLENEKKAFEDYLEKYKMEELEEGEQNPLRDEDSPYFSFMMQGLHRLCFSTADDPFYKLSVSKYYPECVVVDADGTVLSVVNPLCKKDDSYQISYIDDFRDAVLKINDDKKITIGLGAIKKQGISILLFIKENDLTDKPTKEGDFDRSWFRISNEETNQTLDYSLLEKLEKPEDYQPQFQPEDEEAAPQDNPLTYLHGRLYQD